MLNDVKPQLKASFDKQLNSVAANDLYGQLRVLKRATVVLGTTDSSYSVRMSAVTERLKSLQEETDSFADWCEEPAQQLFRQTSVK